MFHSADSIKTSNSLLNLSLRLALLFFGSSLSLAAQTGSSGAWTGVVTDPSGAVVGDVLVRVTNEATGETRLDNSKANGSYSLLLLLPGVYRVELSRIGFKVAVKRGVQINVTETARLDVTLELGGVNDQVTVTTDAALLQTETSTLGRLTNQTLLASMPLATRNFTQIIGLSPGIAAEVNNATEVGRGSGGAAVPNGPRAHGAFARDNNFQMNGLPINDLQASGLLTGGVAIPNPDAIQEFKVQTSLYDAAFGRNAGANVNVVTKSGSNKFHGTAFEFLRNDKLDANDFFRNSAGQPRGVLKQNQFGFTLGGPIKKNELLFFSSYQGTRQRNGIGMGATSTMFSPAFTNDRSRAALGALFAGQRGAVQNQLGGVGPAIAADGSNISAPALALLNRKLPNGQYVIPTPQRVDPTQPFNTRGFSALSETARFSENQYLINIDFLPSERSRIGGRYFQADGDQNAPLPANALGGPITPGFPQTMKSGYRIFSVSHTYTLSPNLVNEIQFGFNRMPSQFDTIVPFEWQDVGVSAPSNANPHPVLLVAGSMTLGGNGLGIRVLQQSYILQDSVMWVRGDHSLRFGGGLTRNQIDNREFHLFGALIFLSWPDFLLGRPAGAESSGGNATPFSNVFTSFDVPIQGDRNWRFTEVNAYAQDNYRVNKSLTLNLGLRYERLGALADTLGRNTGFDLSLLNPNPPASGTVAGYVVSRDFPGAIPAGVKQLNNNFGYRGNGQNTWGPRLGLAWQLPKTFFPTTENMVLRAGYGIYYTRTLGQTAFAGQVTGGGPFAQMRQVQGAANGSASFANPFGPEFPLPQFVPYSPTTQLTPRFLAQDLRPPITQQYSLNLQTALSRNLVLEVAYVGSRANHQPTNQIYNQAQLASPANPIRGETTNTVANIAQRVPFVGFAPIGLNEVQSRASAWYNGLESSLTQRLSRGLQFLVAYTFSKSLSDAGADTGVSGVNAIPGTQNDRRLNYGQSDFNRPHRFVVSYLYDFPTIRTGSRLSRGLLNGWSLTGVTTIQSGLPLTLVGTNINNAYGINGTGGDRAQLAPSCTYDLLQNSGSVASRLNAYFNNACILRNAGGVATWNVIGSDGRATDFGNSGVGIVLGPGQRNFDLSIIKRTPLKLLGEDGQIELRAEFFNAFNTPQFAPPNTNVSTPTFGVISSTAVNPRIIQFAVKLSF